MMVTTEESHTQMRCDVCDVSLRHLFEDQPALQTLNVSFVKKGEKRGLISASSRLYGLLEACRFTFQGVNVQCQLLSVSIGCFSNDIMRGHFCADEYDVIPELRISWLNISPE